MENNSIKLSLVQSFIGKVKTRYCSFIYNQTNPPPFIFFTVFAYSHSSLSQEHPTFAILLYFFALVVLFTSNFNFLFTMVVLTKVNPAIGVATFLCSFIASNEKWKAYIFILTIGNDIFTQDIPKSYFIAFFTLIICAQIYRTLFFRNIGDNKQFFTGMASVSTYYTIQILSNNLSIKINPYLIVLLVIATASFAFSLIQSRINKLRHSDPKSIYSDLEMAHYLKMVEQDILDVFTNKIKLKFHSKNCQQVYCFCHNQQICEQSQYFIRQLYKNALTRFKKPNDPLLFQYYISFLIKNGQVINAIHFLDLWKPANYFEMVGRIRSKARIEHLIRDLNCFNPYQHQYTYALQYDLASLKVAFEINAIIKLKIVFWTQINKLSPRVVRLQELGYEIITKMYELNVFYSQFIKRYEENIFLFDSTAVYAMYMLSTTNFKEYAELIIKNTAKLLEEVYVSQSRASQTFAIRTVVRKEKISFICNPKQHLRMIKKQSISQQNKSGYKLIIQSISTGLCKMLQISKSELINHQLNSIIPDGYRQVHNVRLSHLLDFDGKSVTEIVPSKVLHAELKLPMKGANNKLLMAYICIKFQVDLEQGLTLVSIVKLTHDKCHRALIDFDGNITESDPQFKKQIIQHSQISKYLGLGQTTWLEQNLIKQQKFNLVINKANYGITINSPLTVLFLQKENLKNKCPPFHIEIINEQTNRNRTAEDDKNNKIGMQIKHMEMAIFNYDAQSSTNSSSKGGSAAVNVMNNFLEMNTTPLYRFLQLVFLMTVICCVMSNIGTYYVTDLPWDSAEPTHNPINDTMNFYAVQMMTIKSLLLLGDLQYYQAHPNMNKSRVSQYFGYADYEQSLVQLTSKIQNAFKESINNLLRTPSALLKDQIQKKLKEQIPLVNPVDFSKIYTASSYQNLTYLQIIYIYATDINLMANKKFYNTIFSYSFSSQISRAQNVSYLSAMIDDAVHQRLYLSYGVHGSLMGVIALLVIPLCILLGKRLELHEKVFDILVSIDPKQVTLQIKSLRYILNILRNYKESNQIMKTNVLGYNENVLHNRRESKASAQNQMILGLSRYDHSIDNQIDHQRYDSERQPISNHTKKQTMLNFMEKTFKNKQQTTQVRKRPGELDLATSTLDPNNTIRLNNCALYIISLTFLVILGFSLYYQMEFNAKYLEGKKQLLHAYDSQVVFEQYIITSKVLFAYGPVAFGQIFRIKDVQSFLYRLLQSFPIYDYTDTSLLYSQIISNCSNNTQLPPSFLQKYCQFDYSSTLLMGQFGTTFKELIELRYLIDQNNSKLQYNSTLENIFEKIFYLGSLNLKIEELVLKKITLIFNLIVQLTIDYNSTKLAILGISIIWGVLCCIVGLRIILKMKQEYFKEVFMITFLNNQMILKNKRVESFLQFIAKSNSP